LGDPKTLPLRQKLSALEFHWRASSFSTHISSAMADLQTCQYFLTSQSSFQNLHPYGRAPSSSQSRWRVSQRGTSCTRSSMRLDLTS
jgi:hypothetical protein